MNLINQIVENKKLEVLELYRNEARKRFVDFEYYDKECKNFRIAISKKDKLSLIPEVKKGSPSKGMIRNNFNHLVIADIYNKCNVNAISVLTDKKFFYGDILHLKEIAERTKVPLLRKDFIIDEIQIHQAKAFGADAILLISEILDKEQIADLTETAYSLGLEVLLELHSEEQLDKISFALNKILGINNRDLKTFTTTIETSKKIKKLLPKEIITVSESGISSCDDLIKIKSLNVDAVLVGEYFMRSDNLQNSVTKLLECC